MGLTSMLFGSDDPNLDPQSKALLDAVSRRYYQHQAVESATDHALDFFADDSDDELDRESRILDVQLKRKQLGLPLDSDQLERAINRGTPFYSNMMQATGQEALQRIPEPARPLTGQLRPAFNGRVPIQGRTTGLLEGLFGGLERMGGVHGSSSSGRGIIRRLFR